jgi:hypothetical protein
MNDVISMRVHIRKAHIMTCLKTKAPKQVKS